MPNLVTFSTINEKTKKYRSDYGLDDMGTAFEWLCLEAILNLNEDEIEDAITDGQLDGGIDAIHITGRDVHIFNFKYTELFKNSKKNFPANEIDKILVTMAGIYIKSLKKGDVNDLVWEKVEEIWDLFEKGTPNFKYYLCSNKEKLDESVRKKFERNLDKYKYVEYHYYDQDDIVSRILEKKYRKVNGEINFVDLQYFDRSDGPLKGIVATVAATDLVKLVQDPNDPTKVIEDVFNENVRVYLRLKNRINQGIYDTALSDQNYEFWYLNNGITIVCDECVYTPNTRCPRAKLTNLQIVNGGQTTHALFEAYQKDRNKLNSVLIIVRICETNKDYQISERISETTNSQTPVRTRDLHANDRVQQIIEEQFKALGYFYERKKNQYEDKPKSQRLDNEVLGQLYLAYYLDMASEAKNQKAIVFSDKYEEIFDEGSTSAKKMLIPYRVFIPIEAMKKEIQRKKRKKEPIDEKSAFISRATFHILNSVKVISEKENIKLEKEQDIDEAVAKAISYIAEVVEAESQNRGELYTHDKFFKEIPTNAVIRDYVLSKYLTKSAKKRVKREKD
jgi:hypothetical protein